MDRLCRIVFWALLTVFLSGGCTEKPRPKTRKLTPAEIIPESEFKSILKSGEVADISIPSLVGGTEKLPRISAEIKGSLAKGHYVIFEFGGMEHRIKTESGMASVFTDGIDCAIVDEYQCGSPVRITKIDGLGNVLVKYSEYHHAHSTSCFSTKHKLIFVWIFDIDEIRAYNWDDCSINFIINLPYMQPPLLMLSQDQQFLYVLHSQEDRDEKEEKTVVRKYNLPELIR